jgi:hypothetical protein
MFIPSPCAKVFNNRSLLTSDVHAIETHKFSKPEMYLKRAHDISHLNEYCPLLESIVYSQGKSSADGSVHRPAGNSRYFPTCLPA